MYKILFVCSGNTCRSPLAEALLNKYVGEGETIKDEVVISSCGISAHFEAAAESNAVAAGQKFGVDLSKHKSHQFAEELLDLFDVIIGMTQAHRDTLQKHFPEKADKVFALYEYITGEKDCKNVDDPFGGDLAVYEKTAAELNEAVKQMLPIIKKNI